MLFEGSEKKVEVCIDSSVDLRSLGRDYWSQIVKKSNAEILNVISNDHVDAYLLSESSLFVWNDRFTMITCGSTALSSAVIEFLKDKSGEQISSLIFQRKNEYFARMQPTSFLEDVKELSKIVDGKAFRFGDIDEHYNFLFHLDKPFTPEAGDVTNELLMYNIQGPLAETLRTNNLTVKEVRDAIGVDEIFNGFQVDDFAFEPFGYSLNAIKGHHYCTIHITPQMESSYVSFECNLEASEAKSIIENLIKKFSPGSFDLVSFNEKVIDQTPKGYQCISKSKSHLSCGYEVRFGYFMKDKNHWLTPYQFKLP